MASNPFAWMSSLRNFGIKTQSAAPTKTVGVPGFAVYSGFPVDRERNHKLIGFERWRTYSDNAANFSVVAAGVRHYFNLISRTQWSVEPAKDINGEESSDQAHAAAEFFDSVIHDMETPWSKIGRRTSGYRFWGYSAQEWTAKRRKDGRFGLLDLYQRPQHTIYRWDVAGDGSVVGVVQLSPQTGEEVYIPRNKLLYVVDDSLTDQPEGLGLFRHLVEPAQRLEEYLRIEGIGFMRDLRGIPVGKAPFSALSKAVQDGVITQNDKNRLISGLEDLVKMQAKSAETGVVLDSQPYESVTETGVQVSNVAQWGIDLITGNANGLDEIGKSIERLNREMARILGVEQIMLGDGDSGSRALSEDKTDTFFLSIEAALTDIAGGAQKDLVGPIWALNGLADELKPVLKFEAPQRRDVQKITASLRDMATAGAVLAPNDPAIDDVRDLLGLSRQPEFGEGISELDDDVLPGRRGAGGIEETI